MSKRFMAWCLILWSWGLGSCSQDRLPCLVPEDVWLRVGCYRVEVGPEGPLPADTFLPKPLIGYADSPAVFLLDPQTQRFALVLSPHADQTAVWVAPDSALIADPFQRDTLWIHYDRRLHFISNACGYTYHYSLKDLQFTRHQWDSVVIGDPEVTDNVNTEHVKIYY